MAINVTDTILALSAINFTSDCSTSIRWLEAQGSQPSTPNSSPNNSVDVNFLRGALPAPLNSFSNQTLFNFYNQLADAKPTIWYEPAVESIQADCLAPKLAGVLFFENLDLTLNCSATAAYYSNTLCAINGLQGLSGNGESGWSVEQQGNSQWIVGGPPLNPLNGTSGLTMLRSALPSQYRGISGVELAAWATLAAPENATRFTNKSQVAQICEVCLTEFCTNAMFTGNPDIAGIGAMVSYLMGAALTTIVLVYWLIKTIIKMNPGFRITSHKGPFELAAASTLGALFGGAIALALSLSVALFVLLVRNEDLSTTHSYYEQIMAENATYIGFYMLIILGICFPLSSFKGPEFATMWMTLYYLVVWIQCISIVAVIFDAIGRYGTLQFGDEPCLRAQLGSSSTNNPVVYSTLFFVLGSLSRWLLLLSFTFKALGKLFQLRTIWKSTPRVPGQRGFPFIKKLFSDSEAISLILTSPLFFVGVFFVYICLVFHLICILLINRSLNREYLLALNQKYWQRVPGLMDYLFDKACLAAWLLSFLSLPLMWLDVAFILRVRHAMSVVAGPAWIENQVGFGQILALLIWMPVVVGFILSLAQQLFKQGLSLLVSKAGNPANDSSEDESIELGSYFQNGS